MGSQCMVCGKGTIELSPSAGIKMPYRGMDLQVPSGFLVRACTVCGADFWRPADYERLEAALKPLYKAACHELAVAALDAIVAEDFPVFEVEKALDLSPGYLSKVRAGTKGSSTLAAALALIAAEPRLRMAELKFFWSERRVPLRVAVGGMPSRASTQRLGLIKVSNAASYFVHANDDAEKTYDIEIQGVAA